MPTSETRRAATEAFIQWSRRDDGPPQDFTKADQRPSDTHEEHTYRDMSGPAINWWMEHGGGKERWAKILGREKLLEVKELPELKIDIRGSSTGGDGPDLTGYPNLAYAPGQWGTGVRCHSNGKRVDELATQCEEQLSDLALAAAFHGITLEELFDALRYARANGLI